MATITETVVTSDEQEYETPVYLKSAALGMFWKIFAVNRMLQVTAIDTEDETLMHIEECQYPNGNLAAIADGTASNQGEFETALDSVVTYYKGLGEEV